MSTYTGIDPTAPVCPRCLRHISRQGPVASGREILSRHKVSRDPGAKWCRPLEKVSRR